MRLRDIMSEAVEIIAADASVNEARELMRRQDIRHLVVVERSALRRACGACAPSCPLPW